MPDPWTKGIVALYQDCRERKALPSYGGVLEQPGDIMDWFRIIDERIAEMKKRKREQAENEMRLKNA